MRLIQQATFGSFSTGHQGTTFSGSGEALPQAATLPAFCAPFDVNCWLGQAAQWIAQNIFNVLQPLVDAINQSSLNFITQTPAAGTYQNAYRDAVYDMVNQCRECSSCHLYHHRRLQYHDCSPDRRRLLRTDGVPATIGPGGAGGQLQSLFHPPVHRPGERAQPGRDHLFSLTILSNTIVGIFHGNLLGAGLLAFVLAIILGVMDLLVAWQMLLRLALLILLIVLAPLAFLCGALPQTQGYLRLWLSTFAATVFIQFFQVSALAIGGTLISYVTAANLFNLGGSLLSIITSSAVLYLVLRIPGMLRIWALRPVAEAGPAAQGAVASARWDRLRLIALL